MVRNVQFYTSFTFYKKEGGSEKRFKTNNCPEIQSFFFVLNIQLVIFIY